MNTRKSLLISIVLAMSMMHLQGCTLLAFGAISATAVKVASDRRSAGMQLDDENAELSVSYLLSQEKNFRDNTNVGIQVYNSVALLTGQAPTRELIQKASEVAESVEHITKVHNQIRLGMPVPTSVSTNDLWLASKIRTKFARTEGVPVLKINVVVENKEVFLLGQVTNQEAAIAVEVARNIEGVTQVIRAFEIIESL